MGNTVIKTFSFFLFPPQGSLHLLLLNRSHQPALMLTLSLCLETNLLMLS